MPGYEDEGAQIMRFLADEVSKDCFVNIMEQYHPDAYVGKPKRKTSQRADVVEAGGKEETDERRYAEINRAVSVEEVSTVRQAAEKAGLWRFSDPPKHGGFNI